MNNADFWNSVNRIISDGFTSDGLQQLDYYAELFDNKRLIYKRFSPLEQHGCSKGSQTHVVASLLAGAENSSNPQNERIITTVKEEFQHGAKQESIIEDWAKSIGLWFDDVDNYLTTLLGNRIAEGGEAYVYDHGTSLIKSIGLDYFIQPIFALDRISLHNAYFPETRMIVIGFGRSSDNEFKIIVEQPFICGNPVTDNEIGTFLNKLGFTLINPRNWTYATEDVYLSDVHDENVIQSKHGKLFVIDCDIRINTPELRARGCRTLTTEVEIHF